MYAFFSLDREDDYQAWRARKLDAYPRTATELTVEIPNPCKLEFTERKQISRLISKTNMALLQCTNNAYINKESLIKLGTELGVESLDNNLCAGEDSVSALTVSARESENTYIPYTNRPLSWHTDGYYNHSDRKIQAWSLMCRQDAAEGGTNLLLDHEILYILLRDENPLFIQSLKQADVMTIPPNVVNGVQIRPARSGPVYSFNSDGSLHMRYSARRRNISWKKDDMLSTARHFIDTLFSVGSPYIFRHRLTPGQILISNNVLHNRTGFRDSIEKKRLIYRARYFDRLQPRKTHAETE